MMTLEAINQEYEMEKAIAIERNHPTGITCRVIERRYKLRPNQLVNWRANNLCRKGFLREERKQ